MDRRAAANTDKTIADITAHCRTKEEEAIEMDKALREALVYENNSGRMTHVSLEPSDDEDSDTDMNKTDKEKTGAASSSHVSVSDGEKGKKRGAKAPPHVSVSEGGKGPKAPAAAAHKNADNEKEKEEKERAAAAAQQAAKRSIVIKDDEDDKDKDLDERTIAKYTQTGITKADEKNIRQCSNCPKRFHWRYMRGTKIEEDVNMEDKRTDAERDLQDMKDKKKPANWTHLCATCVSKEEGIPVTAAIKSLLRVSTAPQRNRATAFKCAMANPQK